MLLQRNDEHLHQMRLNEETCIIRHCSESCDEVRLPTLSLFWRKHRGNRLEDAFNGRTALVVTKETSALYVTTTHAFTLMNRNLPLEKTHNARHHRRAETSIDERLADCASGVCRC